MGGTGRRSGLGWRRRSAWDEIVVATTRGEAWYAGPAAGGLTSLVVLTGDGGTPSRVVLVDRHEHLLASVPASALLGGDDARGRLSSFADAAGLGLSVATHEILGE